MNTFGRIATALLVAAPLLAEQPAPVLRLPGAPERTIDPASLRGRGQMDVRLEDAQGGSEIYHGLPLLEILEKDGYDLKSMAAQRKAAAAVVLVAARDGYTVVFSVGELMMHRRDPRVFLVSEGPDGPLPDDKGPVRLIVYGDRGRSAYALARVEVKLLAENAASARP